MILGARMNFIKHNIIIYILNAFLNLNEKRKITNINTVKKYEKCIPNIFPPLYNKSIK